jgi:hypothetical protein
MKGGQNFRDIQQKKKDQVQEDWIHQPICCICKRKCEGYHGRWGDSGSCNATCEAVQAAKEKYPGHTEAEYFNRLKEAA